jgi:LysR family transcriptional regulator, benzoate and cis,cis-muconate-responsive activator of ben and cat genes
MDLRQLRYFVAVAEELHFSRAAARLSLAQSALSSQIRALEREVGGPLLVRSTRRVELTPAGATLFADAREILASVDEALHRVRALARGEAGSMTIGSLGPAPGGILAALLARFSSRHPGLRVEVRAFDFTDTVDGLRQSHADCAFLYLPLSDPELEVTPLLTEQRVVVLPATHHLARRKKLRPADLADETFVVQPSSVPQEWRDHWLLVAENGKRPPTSPHTADKLEDWLHLIANGEGIDTAPAVMSRYFAWPEVAYVPLVDAAPCTLAIVKRRDSADPLVAEFIELAVEIAEHAANSNTPYSATEPAGHNP